MSRIAWPIPLAAELRDLGHPLEGNLLLSYKPLHLEAQQRLQEEGCIADIMVAHKCPESCRGMRLPDLPNSQWTLLASYCANVELVL